MRVISGVAKGRRLQTLNGDDTRPTLERVKEGMFSAVQFWLPGARVLDLFAGSGQLGLEALSRGAASCVFVDESREALALVRKNLEQTQLAEKAKVLHTGALAFLARSRPEFDLVLLDPPFSGGFYPDIVAKVAAVCAARAIVLCEAPAEQPMPQEAAGLHLEKQYRYGTVMVSRYRYGE